MVKIKKDKSTKNDLRNTAQKTKDANLTTYFRYDNVTLIPRWEQKQTEG
jgi:hypothetical protein